VTLTSFSISFRSSNVLISLNKFTIPAKCGKACVRIKSAMAFLLISGPTPFPSMNGSFFAEALICSMSVALSSPGKEPRPTSSINSEPSLFSLATYIFFGANILQAPGIFSVLFSSLLEPFCPPEGGPGLWKIPSMVVCVRARAGLSNRGSIRGGLARGARAPSKEGGEARRLPKAPIGCCGLPATSVDVLVFFLGVLVGVLEGPRLGNAVRGFPAGKRLVLSLAASNNAPWIASENAGGCSMGEFEVKILMSSLSPSPSPSSSDPVRSIKFDNLL
jgi:hypothetical protein